MSLKILHDPIIILHFAPQFDKRIERQDKGEKLSIVFRTCELDDTGTYSCEIVEFVKNGERDQTDCWLQVEGWTNRLIKCKTVTHLKIHSLLGSR